MQNCFREYPEVYGSELEGQDDDEDDLATDATPAPQSATSAESSSSSSSRTKSQPESSSKSTDGRPGLDLVPNSYKPDSALDTERSATQIKSNEPVSESETLVPKAAHDAADENTKRLERK
jgi:intermembrane space import and assembly protein 40